MAVEEEVVESKNTVRQATHSIGEGICSTGFGDIFKLWFTSTKSRASSVIKVWELEKHDVRTAVMSVTVRVFRSRSIPSTVPPLELQIQLSTSRLSMPATKSNRESSHTNKHSSVMTETRLGNGISTTACEDLDTTARLTILIQCPLANDGGHLCSENCSRPLRHEGCLIWNKPMRDRYSTRQAIYRLLPGFQSPACTRRLAKEKAAPVIRRLLDTKGGMYTHGLLYHTFRGDDGSHTHPLSRLRASCVRKGGVRRVTGG
ncbi:hypothetical protein SISSUDRAFT_1118040 [Sistotremastrum suecicum HHB10207 ss-3]|uniref:Uncharacterized protein n=1 Tax=Sistotremastrum suecicum HHB10207 ss-3 TaxID=1314776 RepID=A0A166FKL6_9AGAM|nr:hypothetical protein SISSUDRAFT_1118040 [Sistotremastrum suecicum HHB10207 ss-3]